MKILLTGATGYIAQRLLPVLASSGHHVVCCVRDRRRFSASGYRQGQVSVIESDFLNPASLENIPPDIDAAYYLIHSMSSGKGDFGDLEEQSAVNFRERISRTGVKQVVYLSGIVNEEKLSKHLSSRKNVETILSGGTYALTTLRAGIIIGSGSASFEIIRDLVEKLPLMIAPKWLLTSTQPVAVRNVIEALSGVLNMESAFNRSYDIGGPDILNYRRMLLDFAEVRGLKRRVWVVPVMTPRLSSYWLYFITSTSYRLAQNLVDSMKVEVICRENELFRSLGINPLNYKDSIKEAFEKIEMNNVLSSWKDALTSDILSDGIARHAEVPVHGCFTDKRETRLADPAGALDRIWAIGGNTGWYYGNWLWGLRGFVDKVFGGVGLRRGRKNETEISPGDSLDFWRVLIADRNEKRLLLYAEMKLPGEAWLEFRIDGQNILHQTATFRPLGLSGRLYWYGVLPFHAFVFGGMIRNIAKTEIDNRPKQA